MTQFVPFSLGKRSNRGPHPHIGNARLINCYWEEVGEEGKVPGVLRAVDGLEAFATLADAGGVRAFLIITEQDFLAVAGRQLFRLDPTGSSTTIGGIPSDGTVTLARNRVVPPQVAICCDGLRFIYQGGVLSPLSDPDFPPPVSVASLNGYFSWFLEDGRHYASQLDDADVEALSFAAASYSPDPGVRNYVRGEDLIFFGTRSTEFWKDVGGDPYPFDRTTSTDIGMFAAGSVADLDQTCAFVAHDGTVRVLNGYQAVRISTHAVERFISDETASSLTATSWARNGHTFYCLSGNTGSWVYDSTTGLWHERSSYAMARWCGAHAIQLGRQIIIGDASEGKLYTLSADANDEAGNHLIMTVQPPPIASGSLAKLTHRRLELDIVPGVGTGTSGPAFDPEVMISYADDGLNFGAERVRKLGKEGQRLQTISVSNLGSSRSRTYRFSVSAGVQRFMLSGGVHVEKLGA